MRFFNEDMFWKVLIALFVVFCTVQVVYLSATESNTRSKVEVPAERTGLAISYFEDCEEWFTIHKVWRGKYSLNLYVIIEKSGDADSPASTLPGIGVQFNYFTESGVLLDRDLVVQPVGEDRMTTLQSFIPEGAARLVISPPYDDILARL